METPQGHQSWGSPVQLSALVIPLQGARSLCEDGQTTRTPLITTLREVQLSEASAQVSWERWALFTSSGRVHKPQQVRRLEAGKAETVTRSGAVSPNSQWRAKQQTICIKVPLFLLRAHYSSLSFVKGTCLKVPAFLVRRGEGTLTLIFKESVHSQDVIDNDDKC